MTPTQQARVRVFHAVSLIGHVFRHQEFRRIDKPSGHHQVLHTFLDPPNQLMSSNDQNVNQMLTQVPSMHFLIETQIRLYLLFGWARSLKTSDLASTDRSGLRSISGQKFRSVLIDQHVPKKFRVPRTQGKPDLQDARSSASISPT